MRKFLMAVAIGGLVLLVAAPAMALDFKFGAEYRVRFYDYANTGFDSSNTAAAQGASEQPGSYQNRGNPRGVQLRVRPRFDVSDDNGNITATIRFEYGDTDFGGGGGAQTISFGSNMVGNVKLGQGATNTTRTGNGSGGALGADGVGLETKWAYIDFALPMNIPLRIRAGIQPWYLPKGLIIDDDGAGVRAYGKTGIVSYDLWWLRVARSLATSQPASSVNCTIGAGVFLVSSAASCTALGGTVAGTTIATNSAVLSTGFDDTRDSSFDWYTAKVDFDIAPWLQPGLYFTYGDNRLQCAEPSVAAVPVSTTCNSRVRANYYFGATVTGKINTVDYDLDFVYGSAKGGIQGNYGTGGLGYTGGAIGSPITVNGFALDGGVHIPIGPVKVNLLGSYASGDKQDGGNSEAYPGGISPSWSGAGGQYELIGEGGAFDVVNMTQHTPTNIWMLGATFEYVPVKALWLKAAYGFIGFAQSNGNCAVGVIAGSNGCYGPFYSGKPSDPITGKSTLGQELHFRADYTMWTGFKVQAMAGWLFPTAGDVAGKYILQLLYNF
jgi:hypothetical protein